MKKLILLTAIAAAFAGCSKDMPSLRPADDATRVIEMSVPSDFDWKTMSDIVCDFSAAHASKVSVSAKEGAEPFATFIVGGNTAPVKLSVPRACSTLYVSYETDSGIWESITLPIAETVSFRVPDNSRDYTTQTRADASTSTGEILYPANAPWGTLMFEDLWPSYGDYDFNDFVINYSIKQFLQKENKVERMLVILKTKAVGGSLPFNFYISLGGAYDKDIKEVIIRSTENAADEVTVTPIHTESGLSASLFEIKGIQRNINNPTGAAYLNTERGYELADKQLVKVYFEIIFNTPIPAQDMTLNLCDFFIGRIDEKARHIEIHMGGYKPTIYALNDYNTIKDGHEVIGNSNKSYYSNTNLVWGLHVPADVKHIYEGKNFLEAYPTFKEWAQSGGLIAGGWYLQGVSANLVKK